MWYAFYDLLMRAHAIVSRFQLTIISHDVSLQYCFARTGQLHTLNRLFVSLCIRWHAPTYKVRVQPVRFTCNVISKIVKVESGRRSVLVRCLLAIFIF